MCQPPSCPTGHGPIVYSFTMTISVATIPGAPSLHGNMALPLPMAPCLTFGEASSFGSPPDTPSTPPGPSPPPSPQRLLLPGPFQAPVAPATNSTNSDDVQDHDRMDIDDEVVDVLTLQLAKISLNCKSQLQGEMAQVVEMELCED